VVALDLNGTHLATFDLAQLEYPAAAVSDPQGNLIVVGQDPSNQGIAVKLDPQLQSAAVVISLPAAIHAVTADPAGNIYLTGSTWQSTFPITAGAYQSQPPASNPYGNAAYAFLTEISAQGKVIYSTYFGSDSTACVGGSFCMGKFGVTSGAAIALDGSGAVIVAGTTTATGLPTTPGAYEPTCVCGYNLGYPPQTAGFVAKFHLGAAQQLAWSTFLNASTAMPTLTVNGMALDSAGNVVVGGSAPPGLPATSGAFQLPVAGSNANGSAYLLKLNSAGTAPVWSTYLGGPSSAVQAVFVDAQDRVVFNGQVQVQQVQRSFVARATGDGSTLEDFYPGPEMTADGVTLTGAGPALAMVSTGGFASAAQIGALWIEGAAPGPSLLNITNSASGLYASTVASVELVTLYGVGIGPPTPLAGQVQNNVYTSNLGGYQVLFDGVPAPLLYVDSGQINAVIPAIAEPDTVRIQLVTPTGTVEGPSMTLAHIPVPGIFQNSQTGLAAALNQDGSVNSSADPASGGSTVSVFVTAFSGNSFGDGAVIPMGIFNATIPVYVFDLYRSLPVSFAGDAPGMVHGVMQINFVLPDPLPSGNLFTFYVQIGGPSGLIVQGQIAVAQ
jgi:uncharacterized protein (TIGR03437 family)